MIFDIRAFNFKTEKFEPYGFAVCPVIKELDTDGSEDT